MPCGRALVEGAFIKGKGMENWGEERKGQPLGTGMVEEKREEGRREKEKERLTHREREGEREREGGRQRDRGVGRAHL